VAMKLATLYAGRGQPLSAWELLLPLTTAGHPGNEKALLELVRLLKQQRMDEEALEAYEAEVGSGPPGPALTLEVAGLLKQRARWAEAAEYFRSALSQEERDPQPILLGLAEALSQLGRWAEAERALAIALRAEDLDVRGWLLLAEVLRGQGRLDEVRGALEQALRSDPTSWKAAVELGKLAMGRGDPRGARYYFEAALWHDPYNVEALDGLKALKEAAVVDAEPRASQNVEASPKDL